MSDVQFLAPSLPRPQWGPLGEIVYKRTYSRWLEGEGRRERWPETVGRVVRFSLHLDPTLTPGEQQAEGEELYRVIHNLEGFVSGRTMWMGGSDFSYHTDSSIANWNCSSHSIRSADDLHDLVYLLMSGAGGGPRLTRDVVATFNASHPVQGQDTQVTYAEYDYAGDGGPEHTRLEGDTLIIGDSRAGWGECIAEFVKALLSGRARLTVDPRHVRPLGSRLRSFGGHASGPEPLMTGLREIEAIIAGARARGFLTDVDLLDICCLIGRLVVAGGTRRSALMLLGDSPEFAAAKTGEWFRTHPWRSQGNITVLHGEKPGKEAFQETFDRLLEYGEPGFLNEEAAHRRRPRFNGINPCAEILMANYGVCNLAEVNLMAFVVGSFFDLGRAQRAITALTRHALRITNLKITGMRGNWDQVQKEDRLLGIGLTGLGDLADATRATDTQLGEWLQVLRATVHHAATTYAGRLGVPVPLLATTIKPSGTLSLLPGVSAGVHAPHAPFYLRRIRISEMDAVAKTLDYMGVPAEPDTFNPGTLVFTFPVRTQATRKGSDYSATEQLERYLLTMRHYTDHNTSVTVTLSEEEVPEVTEWLERHWEDDFVAVSFLKKDSTQYPQMPYEAVSEAEYERVRALMPDLSRFESYLEGMEAAGMTATEDLESCQSGACPVR